jgi:hypothetical protein
MKRWREKAVEDAEGRRKGLCPGVRTVLVFGYEVGG